MNTGKKAKAQGKAKKPAKPLRRAQHWGKEVRPMAGKLLLLLLVVTVLGLLFSALQTLQTVWIRLALSLLLIVGLAMMFLNEGMMRGSHDAQASRTFEGLVEKGVKTTDKEDMACYQPLKAVCAAAVVFGLPLLAALYLCITAEPYTYGLQDLPAWLTQTYGMREDILSPLGAYVQSVSMTAVDWMRMLVRMTVMIFINFFDSPLKMSGMIDRLCPLMLLVYPLSYVAGYLYGPTLYARQQKLNRRAKKVAVRKAAKKSLAQELIGSQNQVHYGQQAQDAKKHKKKELI